MVIKNKVLFTGGIICLMFSLLHLCIILGGPSWYRLFGAGEQMATLAEQGSSYPAQVTTFIALILLIWSAYAFSGAGVLFQLPYRIPILALISMVFMLRGLMGIPLVLFLKHPYMTELANKMTFMICSSMLSLIVGFCYAKGCFQLWKKNNRDLLKK